MEYTKLGRTGLDVSRICLGCMSRVRDRGIVIQKKKGRPVQFLSLAFGSQAAGAAGRPNILLTLADDMGYSDVSPYGSEIFTPNIARLAAQGMMLSNFHVAAYCAPTRGMLLTGMDNHVVGLGNMIELAADNQIGKPGYEGGRFGTSKALGAHLGLTPRVYQSGEIDRSGQISKCGDRMLRHLLYEAASALMTRTRKWSRLRAWSVAVAKRRGMKRATVAVARKLAVIMHRIWVSGDEFDFGGPAVAAKAA
jgi:hypothetical protein